MLLMQMRAFLETLHDHRLGPFLNDWPSGSVSRAIVPSTLPVLKSLGAMKAQAPAPSRSVTELLLGISNKLAWRQSYVEPAVGRHFLDNYGYAEIAGQNGPIASERVAAGFLLLGAGTLYPRHRHEAQEVYVPVVGAAQWQGGDNLWRVHQPGAVIFHEREEPHAMRTYVSPLLAIYLWRSTNLNQRSQLLGG